MFVWNVILCRPFPAPTIVTIAGGVGKASLWRHFLVFLSVPSLPALLAVAAAKLLIDESVPKAR